MNGFLGKLLVTTDKKEFTRLLKKIKKYEEITDRYEIEIANFLNKVSSSTMSDRNSEEVRALNSMANDLERIGDIYYQMSLNIDKKKEDKIWFSPEQRNGLLELSELIEDAFQKMIANFDRTIDKVEIKEAIETEALINKKRDKLRKQHLKSMQADDYNMSSGLIYNDLFSSYERIGDHIINVTEALAGEI
jgi:phosphate:Na+ symporter